MSRIGKMLICMGLMMAAAGVLLVIAEKLNIPFGRLPGDITYQKKNVTVFAPFGTMIIVSVVLSLLLNIFSRWK